MAIKKNFAGAALWRGNPYKASEITITQFAPGAIPGVDTTGTYSRRVQIPASDTAKDIGIDYWFDDNDTSLVTEFDFFPDIFQASSDAFVAIDIYRVSHAVYQADLLAKKESLWNPPDYPLVAAEGFLQQRGQVCNVVLDTPVPANELLYRWTICGVGGQSLSLSLNSASLAAQAGAPDLTVQSVSIVDGAQNVNLAQGFTVKFTDTLNAGSATSCPVYFLDADGNKRQFTAWAVNSDTIVVTLTNQQIVSFNAGMTYKIAVDAGAISSTSAKASLAWVQSTGFTVFVPTLPVIPFVAKQNVAVGRFRRDFWKYLPERYLSIDEEVHGEVVKYSFYAVKADGTSRLVRTATAANKTLPMSIGNGLILKFEQSYAHSCEDVWRFYYNPNYIYNVSGELAASECARFDDCSISGVFVDNYLHADEYAYLEIRFIQNGQLFGFCELVGQYLDTLFDKFAEISDCPELKEQLFVNAWCEVLNFMELPTLLDWVDLKEVIPWFVRLYRMKGRQLPIDLIIDRVFESEKENLDPLEYPYTSWDLFTGDYLISVNWDITRSGDPVYQAKTYRILGKANNLGKVIERFVPVYFFPRVVPGWYIKEFWTRVINDDAFLVDGTEYEGVFPEVQESTLDTTIGIFLEESYSKGDFVLNVGILNDTSASGHIYINDSNLVREVSSTGSFILCKSRLSSGDGL